MTYKVFVLYSYPHDKLYVGYTTSLTDYMITMNVMESENPLFVKLFAPLLLGGIIMLVFFALLFFPTKNQ